MNHAKTDMVLFTGNANKALAEKVASYLKISLGASQVSTFSDGETRVEIQENVRGKDVFIIQPTSNPSNHHLMELIFMIDACKRSSASRITAVVPYFGYARQDRRVRSERVPISAKVAANMLESSGADRVITVDLHSDQIQGFFDIAVDNIYASPILGGDIAKKYYAEGCMVVSPDVGGVVRARAIAKSLNIHDLAIIDKRRPKPNESEVMNIIGEVSGKNCVIVDDMIDTGGTLCKAAAALKKHGANKVAAYITHPVLSGEAVANIEGSVLDEVVVSDTIYHPQLNSKKIRFVSIASLLGETIHRVHLEESVSALF